MNEYGELVEWC